MSPRNESNMRAAMATVDANPGLRKPTLRRYTWSRLHTDLLDDNRWALVARRANAPLPVVEAMLIRLENHANRSSPRGYVGDFSADGMAARWNVDEDMIGRIYAQLEAPDIGWIDQDQIVTFWARNPDIVDDTAKERQQRARDRKKGMRLLADIRRQGLITEQQRFDRELALQESREPKALMTAWTEQANDEKRHGASRRDAVTVTTRANQIINQEAPEKEKRGLAGERIGSGDLHSDNGKIVDNAQAVIWLNTEGRALVADRLRILADVAATTIARWRRELGSDVDLAEVISGAAASSPTATAFSMLVSEQIKRRALERKGPRLPLPPVAVHNRRNENG